MPSSKYGVYIIQLFNLFLSARVVISIGSDECGFPAVPSGGKVFLPPVRPSSGTLASYECDAGLQIFGSSLRTCLRNGTWSGKVPVCAQDVALYKPTVQSSDDGIGSFSWKANDGNSDTNFTSGSCARTRWEWYPWWKVDLLKAHKVHVIRLVNRGDCCDNSLRKFVIRVGNNSKASSNERCYKQESVMAYGETADFYCTHPIVGQYVSIHLDRQDHLAVCEVSVFASDSNEIPLSRCPLKKQVGVVVASFHESCLYISSEAPNPWHVVRAECMSQGGRMLLIKNEAKRQFVSSILNQTVDSIKRISHFWIGGYRDIGPQPWTWKWLDNTLVDERTIFWAPYQPNNAHGSDHCISLERSSGWLYWNDKYCNFVGYRICEFVLTYCGSPEQHENSRILGYLSSGNYSVNHVIEYYCDTGFHLHGDARRVCLQEGTWSGIAPLCKLPDCDVPESMDNAHFVMTDGDATSTRIVHYSCNKGYKLIGAATIQCLPSGLWDNKTPRCVLVDCGVPEVPVYGNISLISEDTIYKSIVEYSCEHHFHLQGNNQRICEESGAWSGHAPTCISLEEDSRTATAAGIIIGIFAVLIIITVAVVALILYRRGKLKHCLPPTSNPKPVIRYNIEYKYADDSTSCTTDQSDFHAYEVIGDGTGRALYTTGLPLYQNGSEENPLNHIYAQPNFKKKSDKLDHFCKSNGGEEFLHQNLLYNEHKADCNETYSEICKDEPYYSCNSEPPIYKEINESFYENMIVTSPKTKIQDEKNNDGVEY